ncbi:unnamed protein product [Urochloa decumbens]
MGVDVHEIFVKKSRLRVVLWYVGILFLLVNISQPLLAKWKLTHLNISGGPIHWISLEYYICHSCCQMFAIQTCEERVRSDYASFWGSARDPFLEILKPLINECVTPVTCYWSLALLLRDEEELLLVFQKSRPPVKMLVPVWKALCTLTNSEHLSPSRVD